MLTIAMASAMLKNGIIPMVKEYLLKDKSKIF